MVSFFIAHAGAIAEKITLQSFYVFNLNTVMHSFEVRGGKKLSGDIIPQGAKNEALQIISAVLLTPEKVTITNIPDILDVNLLIELLKGTALVSLISVADLMFESKQINASTLLSAQAFGTAILIYYILARMVVTPSVRTLERFLAHKQGRD